jgi:hypothetical protein
MPPLSYHAGQIAVQEEAKTRHVADKLAHWVGPVDEFALGADMLLFATADTDGILSFAVLSGEPPLVDVVGESELRLRFPPDLPPLSSRSPPPCGGLAISLGEARRARINGTLIPNDGTSELVAAETFTLCRKYMAPSLALEERPHLGPVACEPLALDDPWLAALLAKAETSFLASVSPGGGPDVAHRGGPPGFLELDAAARRLTWPEYVGDGVFKSAGNVRATGTMTLLVPDHDSGDGVELVGRGDYRNIRPERRQRVDALVQHREPFPIQGEITCHIIRAVRLRQLLHPRRRIEKAIKVTSRSAVDEQAPQ